MNWQLKVAQQTSQNRGDGLEAISRASLVLSDTSNGRETRKRRYRNWQVYESVEIVEWDSKA